MIKLAVTLIPLIIKIMDAISGESFKKSKLRKSFIEFFEAHQKKVDPKTLSDSEEDQLKDLENVSENKEETRIN